MSKVKWDVNCPQETKDRILESIDNHFNEIIDLIKADNYEEPDHRILKGLKVIRRDVRRRQGVKGRW